MASRRALGALYVYPTLLVVVAGIALVAGYGPRVGLFRPTERFPVRPLESEPYYGFEVAFVLLFALLAFRAVARARAGKDLWTMHAYWPGVLGAFAALALLAFGLTLPSRGCDVSPVYASFGCWDPTVTFLRLGLAALLTGGFVHVVSRLARGAVETRARQPEDAPAESVEEIRAR